MENIERLFYYTSEKIVCQSEQNTASAKQWYGILRKRISEEEEKHLGILQWLQEQGRNRLSKQDILLYINQNRLKINEVIIPEEAINPIRKKYTTGQLTNYREIVITVPDLEEYYTDEIHFSDVSGGQEICWCRCADYYEECKVLVIDEMQSARHQDAHKYGYKSDYTNYWSDDVVRHILGDKTLTIQERCERLNKYYDDTYKNSVAVKNAVPDTPFHKWWMFLAKRMLQFAVVNGYERIFLTSGTMQVERYSLDRSESEGLRRLYDDIIMGYFIRYLKKWNVNPYVKDNWWVMDVTESMKKDIINNLQPLLRQVSELAGKYIPVKGCLGAYPSFEGVELEYISYDNIRLRNILGWYDRAYDKVYVVVDNHLTIQQFNSTIVHEVLAHYGIKKLLGRCYPQFLSSVYETVMSIEDKDIYQRLYSNSITAAEEYCADVFDAGASDNMFLRKICLLIIRFLDSIGLHTGMSVEQLYESWSFGIV